MVTLNGCAANSHTHTTPHHTHTHTSLFFFVDSYSCCASSSSIPSLLEARALHALLLANPDTLFMVSFSCADGTRLADGHPLQEAVRALLGGDASAPHNLLAVGVNWCAFDALCCSFGCCPPTFPPPSTGDGCATARPRSTSPRCFVSSRRWTKSSEEEFSPPGWHHPTRGRAGTRSMDPGSLARRTGGDFGLFPPSAPFLLICRTTSRTAPLRSDLSAWEPEAEEERMLQVMRPLVHDWFSLGCTAIGGCCRTTPTHIAVIARLLRELCEEQ